MDCLSTVSDDVLKKLLHRVIDGICGQDPPTFSACNSGLSLSKFSHVVASLTRSVEKCAVRCEKNNELEQVLRHDCIPENAISTIIQCVSVRTNDIRKAHIAVVMKACSLGETRIVDIDWNVRLEHPSGDQEYVSIEFDKPELETFLNSLKTAQQFHLKPLSSSVRLLPL
eukprot:gene5443-7158_t